MNQPNTASVAPAAARTEQQESILRDCIACIAALSEQLDAEIPQLHQAMVRTNNYLRQYPDLIHLLTDEQIAPLYQAMVSQAGIQAAMPKAKKPAKEKVQFTDNLFGG